MNKQLTALRCAAYSHVIMSLQDRQHTDTAVKLASDNPSTVRKKPATQKT